MVIQSSVLLKAFIPMMCSLPIKLYFISFEFTSHSFSNSASKFWDLVKKARPTSVFIIVKITFHLSEVFTFLERDFTFFPSSTGKFLFKTFILEAPVKTLFSLS